MKVQRIEQIIIKKSHPKFKIIDEMCINARILYNEANSVLLEHYKSKGEYIKYKDMNYMFKTYDSYKNCFSQPANCVMRLLDKNWKSYFKILPLIINGDIPILLEIVAKLYTPKSI